MLRKVLNGIYRGPRLMGWEYHQLKEHDIQSIVNLESDTEAVLKEVEGCKKYGIEIHSWPMSEILPCSAMHLTKIACAVNNLRGGGVYVHCRRGIDRTGQVIAAWQIMFGGKSFEEAYEEQVSYGHPTLYNLLGWKYILSKVRP